MNFFQRLFLLSLFSGLVITACTSIDVFERNIYFKNHQWPSSEKPVITFAITDTTAQYNIYLVFRHTDAYKFNNIWLKWTVQQPGSAEKTTQQFDLKLANNQQGWLGSGMDDIFEHRILVQPKTTFKKPGVYSVSLEHIMRQDPLENVMNIGLRIEKVK